MANFVKKAYEEWWKVCNLKDPPASQIIEMRRAFYSGFFGCMMSPLESDKDAEACHQELMAFFEAEVKTGFGIPPQEGK